MSDEKTLTCDLQVSNRAGMHTRVALLIYKKMQEFTCDTTLTNKETGIVGSCRSVFDLLALGAAKDTWVALTITGNDAEEAQKAMIELFNNRFYEDNEEIDEEER